jgi:hypothetical protein
MERLHRIHARFILAGEIARASGKIAFGLLIIGVSIGVLFISEHSLLVSVFFGCVIVAGINVAIRAIGEFLGPPEPSVKSSTDYETRRALRRAGLLGRRWRW